MATAYTNAQVVDNSGQPRGYKLDKRGILKVYVQRVNFDAIATGTGVALAANDTFQVFNVRAGETVLNAGIKVNTVTTGASVLDLGFTGGTVDFFVDGFAANSATGHTATTVTDGYFTTTATTETIDLKTLTASGAGGVVDVFMVVLRIGNN
jgi:hypothetical protein